MTTTPDLSVGTVLRERFGFDGMRLTKIVKRTATQAVTDAGTRYRLSDGRKVGGYGTAQAATEADHAEMKRRKLRSAILAALPSRATLDRLTYPQLEALLAALPTTETAK